MKRSRVVAGVAAGLVLAGGTVAAAQDTDALLAATEAADEATEVAREIAEEAESDEGGESHGFDSDAFRERHAKLAAMFEEKGHPVFDEHPALRVHRALANGERPTGVGEQQAAAARRMAEARRQLAEEAGGPPQDGGRPAHAGPPDHAGRDSP